MHLTGKLWVSRHIFFCCSAPEHAQATGASGFHVAQVLGQSFCLHNKLQSWQFRHNQDVGICPVHEPVQWRLASRTKTSVSAPRTVKIKSNLPGHSFKQDRRGQPDCAGHLIQTRVDTVGTCSRNKGNSVHQVGPPPTAVRLNRLFSYHTAGPAHALNITCSSGAAHTSPPQCLLVIIKEGETCILHNMWTQHTKTR